MARLIAESKQSPSKSKKKSQNSMAVVGTRKPKLRLMSARVNAPPIPQPDEPSETAQDPSAPVTEREARNLDLYKMLHEREPDEEEEALRAAMFSQTTESEKEEIGVERLLAGEDEHESQEGQDFGVERLLLRFGDGAAEAAEEESKGDFTTREKRVALTSRSTKSVKQTLTQYQVIQNRKKQHR